MTDLTITEASEKAGVDRSVIEDAMKSGALPNHRRDDWIRVVTPEHLAGWLEWMRESTQTASDGPHESAGMNVSTDIEKPATGRLYAPMTAGTEIATIEPAGALIAVSDQPRLGIGEAGEITVSDRGALKEAIGTTSDDFATSLLWDIGSVDFNEPRANQRLALALSFNPRNGPEALLALQAAILHASMVNVAKRLTRGGGAGVTDRIVKLSRAFDSKIDALKRLRAPASQHVVVEHQYINVGAGGQGRSLGDFEQPAIEAARILLAEGGRRSDTIVLIGGGYPTFVPTSLATLVAPRRPHPPLRWREGKQDWNHPHDD